jgi:hypothetical protein
MENIICSCGTDFDRCKRVINALQMVTLGDFIRQKENDTYFICAIETYPPEQLQLIRRFAEAAVQLDETFPEHRKFELHGSDGELIERLEADNEQDAYEEALTILDSECNVSEVFPDDGEDDDEDGEVGDEGDFQDLDDEPDDEP